MLSPIRNIDFDNLSEVIPAFTVIVLMSFTLNLGIGLTAGFVIYPVTMTLAGKAKNVRPGAWVMGLLSALFLIIYPY
jgi:AGZA family xanthine/uracil permease-like MFS transporter